jgi:hypothetical protein
MYFPRYVHPAVAHSGVACGAATSATAAGDVIRRGPQTNMEAIGTQARWRRAACSAACYSRCDRQTSLPLRFDGHRPRARSETHRQNCPRADSERTERTVDDRDVTILEWRIDDRLIVRYVAVAGPSHAWSSDDDALAFNFRATQCRWILQFGLKEVS